MNEAGTDTKKVWKVINDISGRIKKCRNIDQIPVKNNNNVLTNKNKEKATLFNNFFSSIGVEMGNKIPNATLPDSFIEKDKVDSNIFLKPVTKNEVIIQFKK